MYLITDYDTDTDEFKVQLSGSRSFKYDRQADTLTQNPKSSAKLFTRVGAQEPEKVTLPEGMAGKYYDEKNQENYFEISDDGVTAHIDGTDKTYKLAKAEGNTVTLDNEQVLTYNANDFSITWGSNKYIEESHYKFTSKFGIPEKFIGRYTSSTSGGNYVEIRANDTFYIYKSTSEYYTGEYTITSFTGTEIVGSKVGASNVVASVNSLTEKPNGECTLVYDTTTYTKKPLPVACDNLPSAVTGRYTRADGYSYYEFNGTNVVFFQNGQTNTNWVVTKYDEETKTITIAKENDATSTRDLTYDDEADTVTYAGTLYSKAAA